MKKNCPVTGESFECGRDSADPKNPDCFECWCKDFPAIPGSGEECLGPKALAEAVKNLPQSEAVQTTAESPDNCAESDSNKDK